MTGPVGIEVSTGTVEAGWIDLNGHMNVAYYVLAFDRAVDDFWTMLGITGEYIETTRGSTFAVENHVTWQRELHQDEPYVVTTQIIAYDEKRIHQFQRMYQRDRLYLAATAEWMNLHVDLDSRRVTQWPGSVLERLRHYSSLQAGQVPPAEAGKQMKIAGPLYTMNGGAAGG